MPVCTPEEDLELFSEDEVEATELQNNELSRENAFLMPRNSQRTYTSKQNVHDIKSSTNKDNYEKNLSDPRPRFYKTYLERPAKYSNVGRKISWTSEASRLGKQPRLAVI